MSENPYEPPAAVATEAPSALSDRECIGQRVLVVHIALIVLICFVVTGVYLVAVGLEPQRVLIQAFCFAVNLTVYYWTYRGSKVAARIMVALFGLSGFATLAGAVWIARWMPGVFVLPLLVMAAIYLSFAYVLLASPSVAAFLNRQRRQQGH